jgi:hypothetical protein
VTTPIAATRQISAHRNWRQSRRSKALRSIANATWACRMVLRVDTNNILLAAMARRESSRPTSTGASPGHPPAPAARRAISVDLPTFDPLIAAEVAKLRYVSDRAPGITRRRSGEGFVYCDPGGRPIRNGDALARFKVLRIPPAWTDVWICPDPNGHI